MAAEMAPPPLPSFGQKPAPPPVGLQYMPAFNASMLEPVNHSKNEIQDMINQAYDSCIAGIRTNPLGSKGFFKVFDLQEDNFTQKLEILKNDLENTLATDGVITVKQIIKTELNLYYLPDNFNINFAKIFDYFISASKKLKINNNNSTNQNRGGKRSLRRVKRTRHNKRKQRKTRKH